MPTKLCILGLAIAFGLLGGMLHAADAALTPKQRYNEAMSFQAEAPTHMISLLRSLAEEGEARALDRLAYFTFKGVGTDQDTALSIDLYHQAIEAGRTSSFVALGKVYLSTGAHQMALNTLSEASSLGEKKADAVLAWAHATGRFGTLSDPELGFTALELLAAADRRGAQIYLLDAAARLNRTPATIDDVVGRLHERNAEGDTKAAEALLRYYRIRGHAKGTVQTRASLLKTEGLRDKIRVEEALYLAAEEQPGQFWTVSEELVQTAPPEVYARALSVAARINRNAYVRIVQAELRGHGYKVGRASPYMNRSLIRSINSFCRDTGIQDRCRLGPLKSVTIKAVAAKLAEMRQAS